MSDPRAVTLRQPGLLARIGVGRADITPAPDAPINNWGAATRTTATGIEAPLTATALSIAPHDVDGAEPACVIVALDLGWWRTERAFAHVRSGIAERTGLPADRILLALSHTHAGPAIDPDGVAPELRARVEEYLDRVVAASATAISTAVAGAVSARLEWGVGSCALAHRRDQWLAGEERFICGLDAGAPADSTLLVGRVVDEHGEPVAVLVDYACHPTSLGPANTLISPDYIGAARELVERATGAPMLFLQGASGELAPRRQYSDDPAVAAANGRQLGHAALAVLAGMLPPGTALAAGPTIESGAPLGVWEPEPAATPTGLRVATTRVELPRNPLVGTWRPTAGLSPEAEAERRARAALLAADDRDAALTVPVTVLALGDALVIATPCEAYSALQSDLRREFPDHSVVVVNLAGGSHGGYLPPAHAYDTDLYQVWQTPAGRSALETVRDAAIGLIRSM